MLPLKTTIGVYEFKKEKKIRKHKKNYTMVVVTYLRIILVLYFFSIC